MSFTVSPHRTLFYICTYSIHNQTMKKILLVLAVFALASFTLINTDGEKPKAFDTSYMDPSVSPCDNFYQYAIGGWRANNPIPETESRWMAFNILNEEILV